jgi:hypothetical protein
MEICAAGSAEETIRFVTTGREAFMVIHILL